MRVIDAGVVVKLVLTDLSPDVLNRDSLAAPHLIDPEVLNSLRRNVLLGNVTDAQATRGLQTFREMGIERHPSVALHGRVWGLRHNLSAYDATYVALAEALGTALLTTDARIARAPGLRCVVEVV